VEGSNPQVSELSKKEWVIVKDSNEDLTKIAHLKNANRKRNLQLQK
jgi:hypothetical protein